MASTDQILSRLRRTMLSIFRIGNIQIKDVTGVVQTRNAADSAFAEAAVAKIRIQNTNAVNAVILSAPGGLGASQTYVLPGVDGSTGQILSTDGAGNLSWVDTVANANLTQVESFTEATSSPLTIFTPPANAIIMEISIVVDTAAGASTPTVEVGVSGTPDLYMAATDTDLLTQGTYTLRPLADVTGTPSAVILTITVAGQTFTGRVYVTYANPS